jgi:hypothetical protein
MTQSGRDVNSVDEIVVDRDLAVLESVIHDIELHSDVLFTWDHERSRTALVKLYGKAKSSQWNASTDLPCSVEMQTGVLSQFLHGEQGALVCTGLITATVPWIDAKYYAATQVMDEARHVEVVGVDAVAADRALTTPAQVGTA